MADKDEKKPSRVERAQDRLAQAIKRLEAAAQARANAEGGSSAEAVAATETLRAQLDALQKENLALREAHHTASRRLDATMRRLKGVLEG